MTLLEKIIKSSSLEDVDELIVEALNIAIEKSDKREIIGFNYEGKAQTIHKGFISPYTRIKYSNRGMEDYGMNSFDYFYEFGHFIKKYKITSKGQLVKGIQNFVTWYFGENKFDFDARSDFFDAIAWKTTKTDEEYFEKLMQNKISDLKGKGIAMCTERAALAQNLLALFGFETYYLIGHVNRNNKEECHAFNVVRAKNNYRLLDYSLPSPILEDGKVIAHIPFQGNINLDEIDNVLFKGYIKTFNETNWHKTKVGIKEIKTNLQRRYVVGDYQITQDKKHNI